MSKSLPDWPLVTKVHIRCFGQSHFVIQTESTAGELIDVPVSLIDLNLNLYS